MGAGRSSGRTSARRAPSGSIETSHTARLVVRHARHASGALLHPDQRDGVPHQRQGGLPRPRPTIAAGPDLPTRPCHTARLVAVGNEATIHRNISTPPTPQCVTPAGYGRPMGTHRHFPLLLIMGTALLLSSLPTASIWLSVLGMGCLGAGTWRLVRAARLP